MQEGRDSPDCVHWALVDQSKGAAYVRTAVIFFFVGNEGIWLLENLGPMGVPFPPTMLKALEALQKREDTKR